MKSNILFILIILVIIDFGYTLKLRLKSKSMLGILDHMNVQKKSKISTSH